MYKQIHKPVLLKEVLENLKIHSEGVYVDGTVGTGGHSYEIVKNMGLNSKLIAIDRDERAIKTAQNRLCTFKDRIIFVHDKFSNIENILLAHGIDKVKGILLDLGISLPQLKEAKRGFSFLEDEHLDMRMGIGSEVTAAEVINRLSERELERIFYELGEEKKAAKIAKLIVQERKVKELLSSVELSSIITKAIGKKRHRIHPATKAFMALRIYVNDELNELKAFLKTVPRFIDSGGRLVIISYHSLEDRIVKEAFRSNLFSDFKIITKKPIVPHVDEIKENPSARSAKMRVVERG